MSQFSGVVGSIGPGLPTVSQFICTFSYMNLHELYSYCKYFINYLSLIKTILIEREFNKTNEILENHKIY